MSQSVIQTYVSDKGEFGGRFFKVSTIWRQFIVNFEPIWGHETIIFEGEKSGVDIAYKKIIYQGEQNFYGHHQLIIDIYERGIEEAIERAI